MKKILFLFALLFMGAMTAFAQVPVNEQLTYQTVVRNAQNQLVFSQDNVSVTVEVCNADGSVVRYSETHTGLSTNANGLLTLMVGGGTLVSGAWTDIDWSDAAIRTTVSYDPGTGIVSIPSGLAPISAVPYALQAGNASNTTNLIGDAIHDSIVNNISSAIHDSITNYLTNNNYVTETVMGSAIHDSITNNVTNTISDQIHDSIVNISGDLTDLENRVNTFNTHVCDSVKDCVTGWIHDSIASNISDNVSEQIHDSITNYLTNNNYVTETVMGNAIHDSITGLGDDLTDLENRVNTFNTHVCDSVKDCVTGWIHDSIASNIADNVSGQIHDSIVYNINNNISEQIHDSVSNYLTNNNYVTETVMGNAIHDSITGLGDDLTDLENRVNTFNTHVCDSVQDCIKNYLNDNHYVTETVMGSAIHDSITNNITNTISEQIHDSIVSISGDLTDLENRVNTFNTHVCDSVKDCVTGWIHDSIANLADNLSDAIHDSIVYNIENNISEQIHDSVTNYLTNNHYVTETNLCTTIETNCTNVALRNGNTFTGEHHFTGADSVTVPDAISPDLATALASPCTQEAVNLCDLLAVFDSLNHRINELADEITALKNSIPPAANAPTVSNVTSTSMNVKANASSQGAAITSYEFCYSTNSDMSGATCQTVQASVADSCTFTGLTPNNNYYVQYSATNFAGTTPSPIVAAHTPAHAPTADVTPPVSTKPAGFKVDVKNIDPKEKTDETTVQVCYTLKTGTDCPEKESADYAECKTVDATGVTDTTISVTGLTPSTEYCAIVKVSNGDSTSIYGPWSVTTGANVSMTVANDGGGTVNLCGESTRDVPFTATITGDNASDFTFTWSAGTSTTSKDTVALDAGTHTITVTATHATEGYTLTATASVTVNASGTPVSVDFCESEGIVSVKGVSGSPNYINWGDDQTGTSVTTSTSHNYGTTLAAGSHSVTITASNASGCTYNHTMTVNVLASGSTAADRTVKPCDVGSHAAQTGSAYTGNGHSGANYGFETVNGSGQITSVTDYDGNEYPVVQIGSQCWLAWNLRCEHSPKTGNNIVVTAVQNYGSKMAAWYKNDKSTYEPKRYGLLYNWCAVMDTANPSSYVEVATAANTSNQFSFNPSGNHQGVCPIGWHVPTDAEWSTMVAAAEADEGGSSGTGNAKLTTGCDWSSSGVSQDKTTTKPGNYSYTKRNESGFSAVPAGFFDGSFRNAGGTAYFWSATQGSDHYAWFRSLGYSEAGVYRYTYVKVDGFSVRCVRDIPTLKVSTDGGGTVNLCGESTRDVPFTATVNCGLDVNDFNYTWSAGTSTTNKDTVALAAGTHTITVTATHTTEGYTLTATASVTVNASGTPVSVDFCESEGIVSVKGVSGSPNYINWGDDQTGTSVTTSTSHNYGTTLVAGSHSVTITASNASGCTYNHTMTVNVLASGSTAADRTVKPCDVGSHAAQTGSAYTGNGHSGANYGFETVNGSGQITSVTDYDGNEYPVVQIGSQCWMAENLRCSHSPKTGSNIVVTAVKNAGSKMAAWYNNDKNTYEPKRYGLLYNWCAAMDTAKPSDGSYTYVEVATAANTSNQFSFTPSGPHQGVCPKGWHVPTNGEFTTMRTAAGANGSTGNAKLTTGCDWSVHLVEQDETTSKPGNYSYTERNESGFSVLPASSFTGSFSDLGLYTTTWSATQTDIQYACGLGFRWDQASPSLNNTNYKYYGLSVRCVRN